MSWFWGSQSTKDATSALDPNLREFLDKETARTQADTKTSQQPPKRASNEPSREYSNQLGLDQPGIKQKDQFEPSSVPETTTLPAESQFQDGRYAHLWKTYRPQADIEAAGMTDQDKLAAILNNVKDRKAAIGRAAIENCVFEQLEQHNCFTKGNTLSLASVCSTETKALNRCYSMQARFLKALGYLSSPRSVEEEERIQAHADKLYQQMLERERQAEEAKEKGIQLPPAQPLLDGDSIVKSLGEDSAYARMRKQALEQSEGNALAFFSQEDQQKIREKVKDMNDDEKALEYQLLAAEVRVKRDLAERMTTYQIEEVINRRKRREEGNETIGDRLKRYGGWSQ